MKKNDEQVPLETGDKQINFKALEDALCKMEEVSSQINSFIQQTVAIEKIRGQTRVFASYVNHAGKLNSTDMQREAAGLTRLSGPYPKYDIASRQLVEEILKLLKAGVTKERIESHSKMYIESAPKHQRISLFDILRRHTEMALKEMYPEARNTQIPYKAGHRSH